MVAHGRDLDDFARFVGVADRRSPVDKILSAGQGETAPGETDLRATRRPDELPAIMRARACPYQSTRFLPPSLAYS